MSGADWDVVSHEDMPAQTAPVAPAPAVAAPQDWTVASSHPIAGPSGDFWTDAARKLGTAVVDAGTGLVAPLMGLKNSVGVDPVTHHVVQGPTPDVQTARDNAFTSTGVTEYQPQTLGGRLGQAALTGAVVGATSPESLPSMIGGSTTSELAAELFPQHPMIARMLGFLPGAFLGGGGANTLLKPGAGSMDQPTAQLAQTATQDYGIPLAPGQLSGNPFVRYFYSQTGRLPFSGAENYAGTQQEAFNRAVSQTFGENAGRITPEVLQGAKTRIGGMFNDVAANTTINPAATHQLVNDLADVETNAPLVMTDAEWSPIRRQLDNVLGKVQPGDTISGDAYQSLTRQGTPLSSALESSNPNIRMWAGKIRSALDNALEASASPDDLAKLQAARAQWKAMRTVEPLTVRADTTGGATPTTGDISPAALRGAVNQSYGNVAFASNGTIPLNDLAKIGQRFLKEPPDSGTASRTLANHAVEAAGGLSALALGHEVGMPLLTSAAGTAATLGANRMVQAAMRSPFIADRMIRAGMNPNGFSFNYVPSLGQQAPILMMPPERLPFSLSAPATSANSGTP